MVLKNIGFLKFAIMLCIIMHHARDIYHLPAWLGNFQNCTVCPDLFFIISGFLLFYTFNNELSTFDYAKKRFLRLAPNVWLLVLIMVVLTIFIPTIDSHFNDNILRIFLLHCVGVEPMTGGSYMNITWYISALFWVSLFYFYISKVFDKKYLNLIIWLVIMLCYALYMQHTGFLAGGHIENCYLVFNVGICKALASMGLGYFIYMAYQNGFLQNVGKAGEAVISVLEAYIMIFFCYYFVFANSIPGKSGMIFIVLFAILFYLFLIKKGFLSKLLENNFSNLLGQYVYSMYCFQIVVLAVFIRYVYVNYHQLTILHPFRFFSLEVLIAVFLGVIMYYIFERPVAKYIKKNW